MRAFSPIAILTLLAGCAGEAPQSGNKQEANRSVANSVLPEVNESVADPPQSDSALAAMSPRQRRAYDRGLTDCRAGRYQPADHPEAYRIGCAAAHD